MINYKVYDIEIFRNYFGITLIPLNFDDKLINAYTNIDKEITQLKYENVKDDNKLKELYNKKEILFKAFKGQTLEIWKDTKSDKFKNDLALIQQIFTRHQFLYGYNSYNYDATMLDILLFNARWVRNDGYHTKSGKHITEFMFEHSVNCISFGKGYWRVLDFRKVYKRPFTDFDIQKILYLDKTFTALKQVAICLKWHRIQNLPIDYDDTVDEEDLYNIKDYNINDVLITRELILNQIDEIELRKDLSKEFDIDFRNMSRSSVGKAITSNLYSRFSGIPKESFEQLSTQRSRIRVDNLISNEIEFQTDELNNFLNTIKTHVILVGTNSDSHKFRHEFVFKGKIYCMALGGLHSGDNPTIYDDSEYILRDADVTSFYPNGILKYDVCPAHLERKPFRATVGYTKDVRVEAKKLVKQYKQKAKESSNQKEKDNFTILADKNNTKAEGLKIAINRMYGAFRDKHDYLFDPLCTYKTTINLQLCLMMLIEALELNGIEVISANTDGIVSRFKKEQEKLYQRICNAWELKTSFELEYTDYEKYFRNDVNNYIAIKKGFSASVNGLLLQENKENKQLFSTSEVFNQVLKMFGSNGRDKLKNYEKDYIKRKGLFIEEIQFNKGYNSPIVSTALNLFFIYGVDYRETIKNHINSSSNAIYDYCISQKTDSKFDIIYSYVENGIVKEEYLQKSNRFYISLNPKGTIIKKEKEATSQHRIVAKFSVIPFNDYIYKEDYDLNFGYYFNECSKIIYGDKYRKKKTLKKQESGVIKLQATLFDTEQIKVNTSFFGLKEQNYKEESVDSFIEEITNINNIGISKENYKTLIDVVYRIESFVENNIGVIQDDDINKLKVCYESAQKTRDRWYKELYETINENIPVLENGDEEFDDIEDLPF